MEYVNTLTLAHISEQFRTKQNNRKTPDYKYVFSARWTAERFGARIHNWKWGKKFGQKQVKWQKKDEGEEMQQSKKQQKVTHKLSIPRAKQTVRFQAIV